MYSSGPKFAPLISSFPSKTNQLRSDVIIPKKKDKQSSKSRGKVNNRAVNRPMLSTIQILCVRIR